MGASGRLFRQHYLDLCFPVSEPAAVVGTAGDARDVERLPADAGVSQAALPIAQRTVREVSRL